MTQRDGCRGKLRHPSQEMAQAAVASTLLRSTDLHRETRARLEPYYCWRCGYWHIGHKRAFPRKDVRHNG